MTINKLKTIICVLLFTHLSSYAQQTISLEGSWEFSMGDSTIYNDYVMLPGSMLTNGKGDNVTTATRWTASIYDSSFYFNPYMEKYRVEGDLKLPFFLTPAKHYVGKAWYKRSIYIPNDWKRQHVTLFLERPHIETTVYINGQLVGHDMSLSTPHEYDVTSYLVPGQRNTIAICVYNGIEHVGVGQDSHSVTDQTQGNWNGITGRIELVAKPKNLFIKQVRLYPYPYDGIVQVDLTVGGTNSVFGGEVAEVIVQREGNDSASVMLRFFELTGTNSLLNMPVGKQVAIWDEFHPALYRIGITVGGDYYETTFGMREMSIEGRQLMINRRPLFLRGTVENCCFPETGFPPTDEQSWKDIFLKCKSFGLNHMRFHSYCPPEAAFAAADKIGFYLQPEGPTWPNHDVKLGIGQVIDDYLMQESKRIVATYGHHPSFVMMAAGNEPAGKWVTYCNDWVKEMQEYDPFRLYCGSSVGGGWAWDEGSDYHVKAGARGLDWVNHAPSSDDDYNQQILYPRNYTNTVPNESPIIAHEQGQWCAFPNLNETTQYTGVYKAKNFEVFRDLLRENGLEQQAEKFLMASGKLQTLCYKYEIERNLRTKDYAGFQLLSLNDYSGQGTALVGVLNVHWREKGYTSAREWTEFCSPVVPLAKFPKFVYTTSDSLVVPIEAYNAFYGDIQKIHTNYYICDDSLKVITGGQLVVRDLPVGKNTDIGTVRYALDSLKAPGKYTLFVTISGRLRNHWDFWVYPDSLEENASDFQADEILISDTLDSHALSILKKGGKVLLTAAGKVRLGNDVVQHYLPVFWNTSWFKMRPPHTTGAYIDKTHPLFSYGFPTDDWGNLNWWELLNGALVMNLLAFPKDYQSPIQPIDTWHVSRKLGMLVEANVLKGKLLMTTMDITSDMEHRVVARQMRQAILRYMQSEDFKPSLTLEPKVFTDLYTQEGPKVEMFTKASTDELVPQLEN